MYRCEICKNVVPANTPITRITAETRAVTYPYRPEANRKITKGSGKLKPHDPGGRGFEIVRELIACPDCAGKRQK
jgi:hypothetical protein